MKPVHLSIKMTDINQGRTAYVFTFDINDKGTLSINRKKFAFTTDYR